MYKTISRSMKAIAVFAIMLTTVLILTVSYNFFDNEIKQELKNEVILLADILDKSSEQNAFLKSLEDGFGQKRITLLNSIGTVLYDNRPDTFSEENIFKKIIYHEEVLNNGNIIRISKENTGIFEMLIRIILPIIIIVGVVYLVTIVLSVLLTENITKPINNIDLSAEEPQNAYDEIMPLVDRIALQNREIKKQINRVKTQKNRLQVISENMGEGLVVLDKDKKIISLNSISEQIFNVLEEDVLFGNFFNITDNTAIADSIEKTYLGKKNWITTKIGNNDYEIFLSPVGDSNKVSSIIMIIFEVTEKQKAQKMRQEFTANVSHELKTPLTTILGYTQIINQGMVKPEDMSDFTGRILKETTRLIGLVDDIMKLSKLDEGNMEEEKADIKLSVVLEDVTESLYKKAEENSIKINLDCDDSVILGNISQITELIYNLVDNAIKYNKPDGSVSLSVKNKELKVTDTGIGIPKRYIENIWERFFRVDKSRSKKTGGTGLGLSIVKHIAICHDAEVFVKSTEGEGTEFTVKFK